jgi:predicted RNA-binding Zn ribbon-like protein
VVSDCELGSIRPSKDHQFDLTGGVLCLNFVNTLGDRPRKLAEHLRTFGDLLSWSGQTGVLEKTELRQVKALARNSGARTRAVMEGALRFRETLYVLFSAIAAGKRVDSATLKKLTRSYGEAIECSELVQDGTKFTWIKPSSGGAIDSMLWAVVLSAVDLLTSEDLVRLRECASGECSWLFLDRSRTGRRKWCDMKVCGNRNKARRHYARKKAAANRC